MCREVNVPEPTKYEFVLLDYGLPADGIIGNDMSIKIQNFEDLFGWSKLSDRSNEIKRVSKSEKTIVKSEDKTEIKLKTNKRSCLEQDEKGGEKSNQI